MASVQKQPRKGILKTSSSFDKVELPKQPKDGSKEMKWDEMNILATNHPPGKDYGHMKIDEPPTPYSKYSDPEDDDEAGIARRGSFGEKDSVDPSSLSSKLEDLEKPRIRRVSTEEEDESSEEEGDLSEEQLAIKKKFEQKRKIHYNEFQAVKLAQQLMEEEEEEEDDNDDNTEYTVKMVTDSSQGGSEGSSQNSQEGTSVDIQPSNTVQRETRID